MFEWVSPYTWTSSSTSQDQSPTIPSVLKGLKWFCDGTREERLEQENLTWIAGRERNTLNKNPFKGWVGFNLVFESTKSWQIRRWADLAAFKTHTQTHTHTEDFPVLSSIGFYSFLYELLSHQDSFKKEFQKEILHFPLTQGLNASFPKQHFLYPCFLCRIASFIAAIFEKHCI